MAADTVEPLEELRTVIRKCPIIDNHAHNLLRSHHLRGHDFLTLTSEAEGEALEDTPRSLPHIRAARQLCRLYDLPIDAEWDTILARRRELLEEDPHDLVRRCLDGTQTILIDDGLADGSKVEPYGWHDKYTASPCKRVVRIEAVAANIFSSLHQQGKLPIGVAIADQEACLLAWTDFITAFEQSIASALADPEVAGFKSVICYRTGLHVQLGRDKDVLEAGLRSFRRHYLSDCISRKFRIDHKGMNDALVISVCKLIESDYKTNGFSKPFQFHTGLGDNDISLLTANPACLQPLISAYPEVPFVLLHSSYPFTREAGYLASVYKNAYLDIGEVFPMISRDGQEHVIRQAMELSPLSKILWSTDGHYFPETFWLANVQGREALERILCEYVLAGDMTMTQAVKATRDILFHNSNRLYRLGLVLPAGEAVVAKAPLPMATTLSGAIENTSTSRSDLKRPLSDPAALLRFISPQDDIKFVFVQWLDMMAIMRTRCLTISAFKDLIQSDGRFAISSGNLGTVHGQMSPVCEPVGSIFVEPDLRSLRKMQIGGPVKNSATVLAGFTDAKGTGHMLCPRARLNDIASRISERLHIDILVGFEIEITFCRRNSADAEDQFSPLDTHHDWCTFTDEQYITSMDLMTAIATTLLEIGIEIPQLHSEAGIGQYEFIMAPLPPVEAVDALIQARQCIQQMAATQGLRATCHPRPFAGIGTAAHSHISFNGSIHSDSELEEIGNSFMAAVLAHLSAICMITMPQEPSYDRVVNDSWTGGTSIAWGTENREVPLRKVNARRWEVRCLDGTANMYLALYALLSAGEYGIEQGMRMEMEDCTVNPSKLSDEEKKMMGITKKMPKSIEEAIEAFEKDSSFISMLGSDLATHLLALRKFELEMTHKMSAKEKRVWLMERY